MVTCPPTLHHKSLYRPITQSNCFQDNSLEIECVAHTKKVWSTPSPLILYVSERCIALEIMHHANRRSVTFRLYSSACSLRNLFLMELLNEDKPPILTSSFLVVLFWTLPIPGSEFLSRHYSLLTRLDLIAVQSSVTGWTSTSLTIVRIGVAIVCTGQFVATNS